VDNLEIRQNDTPCKMYGEILCATFTKKITVRHEVIRDRTIN